jgi:predicted PhzF superfamily epimerase YddE/YHI9
MKVPFYHLNAFTSRRDGGNGAGVCPLDRWLDGPVMQDIAAERGLAETAFFVPDGKGGFALRWFTPEVEIDLCGHATLASAHVLFHALGDRRSSLTFHSKSGPLTVRREDGKLTLDFPSRPAAPAEAPDGLLVAMGHAPREVLRSRDYLLVYEREADVRALEPEMALLDQVDTLGVIATAPGESVDFVSRFFAPRAGVPEDPATGSSHCTLIPYWSRRLGRNQLHAHQVSSRGGEFWCRDRGERVDISGEVVLVLEGVLHL